MSKASSSGTQYACGQYRQLLAASGITSSMSRTGNYDNALMESFWASWKIEEVHRHDNAARAQAAAAIFDYLEIFYHRKCRHSALNYLSPEAFEAQLN